MRCGIEGCASKVDEGGFPLDGVCRAPSMDCTRADGKRQSIEALSDSDPDAGSPFDAMSTWAGANRTKRIKQAEADISSVRDQYSSAAIRDAERLVELDKALGLEPNAACFSCATVRNPNTTPICPCCSETAHVPVPHLHERRLEAAQGLRSNPQKPLDVKRLPEGALPGGDIDIIAIACNLHSHTGAGEAYAEWMVPAGTEQRDIAILQARLIHWRPSDHAFDAAIHAMLVAVLAERGLAS